MKQLVVNKQVLVQVVAPLIVGSLIYVFLRDSFIFFTATPLNDFFTGGGITAFIQYNLPDGLWLYGFMRAQQWVWNQKITQHSIVWILMMPFMAFGSEYLQWCGLIRGTYDILDVCIYACATIISISKFNFNFNFKSVNNEKFN